MMNPTDGSLTGLVHVLLQNKLSVTTMKKKIPQLCTYGWSI